MGPDMSPEPETPPEKSDAGGEWSTWRKRRSWHGPPAWFHPPEGTRPPWQSKRRFLFWRVASVFLAVLVLFLLGMGGLAYLLVRLFGGGEQTTLLLWPLSCGLALVIPILTIFLVVRSFRGLFTPLARVMAAADAVAEGDLSVRVPEEGRGEMRRMAQSFNRMVTKIQTSDELRRNLTADVAHELRTPLHIIQGNLEGIQDGVYTPDAEHVGLLLEETGQLARLVEDLRTLSLSEAGQLTLKHEPVDVAELLDDVATRFSGQAEAAGVTLKVEKAPQAEALSVMGDAGRLDQVLSNLVVNALRHTPAGGTITLRTQPASEGVCIQVADNGSGIPAADLPFIFDRFWRGDSAHPGEKDRSSGLGLAIARQLVQAHRGKISVVSQPDQGTTFSIDLPIKESPAGPK